MFFQTIILNFCLHRCDESTNWLIEIENRMSNSNWLQKFWIWTNWIYLNLRFEFDWKTRRNVEFKKFEKCRKNILIYMWFKFFWNFFFVFSSIYDIFVVSKFLIFCYFERRYFLKILKWCFWMYDKKNCFVTKKLFFFRCFRKI